MKKLLKNPLSKLFVAGFVLGVSFGGGVFASHLITDQNIWDEPAEKGSIVDHSAWNALTSQVKSLKVDVDSL